MSGPSVRVRMTAKQVRRHPLCMSAAPAVLQSTAYGAEENGSLDLVTLPIEQLPTLEVYSASKFTQKPSDAPSAVAAQYAGRSCRELLDCQRDPVRTAYRRRAGRIGERVQRV